MAESIKSQAATLAAQGEELRQLWVMVKDLAQALVGEKSLPSVPVPEAVGHVGQAKGLPYPNDSDGGGRRVAAIQMLERKLGMAERDGDAVRVERYRQELEAAKDASKPLK